jgi:hypothetical protein
MADIDVLVPRERMKFKFKDRSYEVGEMSFDQVVRIQRFLIDHAVSKRKDSKDEVILSESNRDDFIFIFGNIKPEKRAGLIGIFIDEKDTDFVRKEVLKHGNDCMDIIEEICNNNDFGKILVSFPRATRKAQEQVIREPEPPRQA